MPIIVTSIKKYESGAGAIVRIHCPMCEATYFIHHPYAATPTNGDYFAWEGCVKTDHNRFLFLTTPKVMLPFESRKVEPL